MQFNEFRKAAVNTLAASRGSWGVFFIAIACVDLCCTPGLARAQVPAAQYSSSSTARVVLAACKIPNLAEGARCGSYEVYENRTAQTGRKIALNIVIFPALSPTPAPDPLFWIAGGPGLGATAMARLADVWFADVRKARDLVFVDQRGSGQSNALNCDYGSSPSDLQGFFGPASLLERVRRCRQQVESHADLRLYTTSMAMDDLDEVRAALGYSKINVAGMSYGAVGAQVYLKQHSDHVRTASAIAVITPDYKLPLGFPRSAQNGFNLLFEDCFAETACHAAFPNLAQEFNAVITRFDRGPVRVEMLGVSDRQKQEVLLSKDNFFLKLVYVLANTDTARLLPYIIHRAFENDYVPYETVEVVLNPASQLARGLYFSATCSESVPFITDADIVRETAGTAAGDHPVREHMAACKEWPHGDVPENYLDPLKSDIPVLMITGEADPISAPWFARNAINHLPNGKLVIVHHFGHQFGDPCTRGIVSAFIEKGSATDLDISCTDLIRRPSFATELPARLTLPTASDHGENH